MVNAALRMMTWIGGDVYRSGVDHNSSSSVMFNYGSDCEGDSCIGCDDDFASDYDGFLVVVMMVIMVVVMVVA